MGYDLLMQHFHTAAVLAEALSAVGERITPQAIYKWKRNGIPLDRAPQIEVVTSGALRCEALCPQVEWVRGEDGQIIGYSVPVQLPDGPPYKDFQPCRTLLRTVAAPLPTIRGTAEMVIEAASIADSRATLLPQQRCMHREAQDPCSTSRATGSDSAAHGEGRVL